MSIRFPANWPIFKYHPDPIASGVIIRFDGHCPCCQQQRGWGYVGPFFCVDEVENLCPWCIADGRAAQQFDLTFIDEFSMEQLGDSAKDAELMQRTPNYFYLAMNDSWPHHCGDYCRVVPTTEITATAAVAAHQQQLQADITRVCQENDLTEDEFNALIAQDDAPFAVQLFQCCHCHQFRLTGGFE
ncbi:CbrC family protein [Shewanella sp.]|uniref:CbrC family protein n=1 Tax=Shewanella sp. TaxID=50422 RepID=UPI003A970BB4